MLFDRTSYLKACEVPTSSFNYDLAKHNISWLKLIKAFNTPATITKAIPRIIHFIWIGHNMPYWYRNNIHQWKENMPDFDFIVWDNINAQDIMSGSVNKHHYFNDNNIGLKSDLLRYEILYNYGGLYMDADFVCVRPELLRLIHDSCSFYSSVMLDQDPITTNGFIGCEKESKIIRDVIYSTEYRMKQYEHITCPFTKILFQTGPRAINESVFKYLDENVKILPSKCIFPFPAELRNDGLEEVEILKFITDETLACHLWHTSWQRKTLGYLGPINNFVKQESNNVCN